MGNPLRPSSDTLSGLYLVVTKAGTSIDVDVVRGLEFGEGDWVLCVDANNGWIRIVSLLPVAVVAVVGHLP